MGDCSDTGPDRCDSVLIIVPNENVRSCELPTGHVGPHRAISEWTDEDATQSEEMWR